MFTIYTPIEIAQILIALFLSTCMIQSGFDKVFDWKGNNDFLWKLKNLSGQALHAKTLEFYHPKTKKWMSFDSELPQSFNNLLELLENLSGWNIKI